MEYQVSIRQVRYSRVAEWEVRVSAVTGPETYELVGNTRTLTFRGAKWSAKRLVRKHKRELRRRAKETTYRIEA